MYVLAIRLIKRFLENIFYCLKLFNLCNFNFEISFRFIISSLVVMYLEAFFWSRHRDKKGAHSAFEAFMGYSYAIFGAESYFAISHQTFTRQRCHFYDKRHVSLPKLIFCSITSLQCILVKK